MDQIQFAPGRETRIGQQFGSYLIERTLGYGGFATVFLGRHQYLDTYAAIKILHRQFDSSERQLFINEARMAVPLVHPHIVRVFEYGVQFGKPYLVMDYAPRGSFGQFIGTGLPLTLVVRYAKQIASGLDYLNAHGIIHCDIKPHNLLIGQDEQVLISDFGIALLTGNVATHERIIRGTLTYMAPEQILGNPCFASDQYSMAVVLYELLCGLPPFEGTGTGLIKQHLYAEPPSLRERKLSIPHAVEDIILQALAKDPEKRYDSAGRFAIELELAVRSSRTFLFPAHWEESLPSSTDPAHPVVAHQRPPYAQKKEPRWFAIGMLCFVDLVVTAIMWLLSALLHIDVWIVAWLVVLCLIIFGFAGVIVMKHLRPLQLTASIFALGLLIGFVLHNVLAFLATTHVLLIISIVVTYSLSLRNR